MDSATLASQLASYDANPVTAANALNTALGQFGVPEIRNTVSGLRTTVANTTNALNNVDPSVTGRTQGSLVTEAQRQRQVSNERAPIADQLQSQGSQLSDQEKALQDALSQATTQSSNQVNDYEAGRSRLQSEYDTAYKREQDTATAQAAQAAAAEQVREFNAGLSAKSSSSGGSASSSDVKGAIQQGLSSVTGKDGYVSPQDYANGLKQWLEAGLPRDGYNKQFKNYRNPSNPYYDYAIKQAGL